MPGLLFTQLVPFRALSLRQPWAWMVMHGGKNIENRVWNTHHRGGFLVHASKGCTLDEYDYAVKWARVADKKIIIPTLDLLPRGVIVGMTSIINVLPPCSQRTHEGTHCRNHPWHIPWQNGFVLGPVKALRHVVCRGFQRWFDIHPALHRQLVEAESQHE